MERMGRVIEGVISLFEIRVIVQLCCRHPINPNDPACRLDHGLQFGMILSAHVPEGAAQTKGQNTLNKGFIEHLEDTLVHFEIIQFSKEEQPLS